MQPLRNYFKEPRYIGISLLKKFYYFFSDKTYLRVMFYLEMKKHLNLRNPQTFNEKLQWLKLYNRNPLYTKMVDKYLVKDYVSNLIGDKYIIPNLGVWEDAKDIDFNSLPNEFVLKATHLGGSTGVIICRDKFKLDILDVQVKLNKALKRNNYLKTREWPYKNVVPKILAETFLNDGNAVLNDFKVMCFNGVAKLIELHQNRFSANHTQDFYDRDWNKTNITQGSYSLNNDEVFPKPICLSEMLELSEKISKGIPHCRVDWYVVEDRLYFGEITFFDGSGFTPFDNYEDDYLLGSWIDLNVVS